MHRIDACVVFLALLSHADVTGAQQFTELVVFGDSLSDVGNSFLRNDNERPPNPPYWQGRWSNGPNWVDLLADHVAVSRAVASESGGSNFAFGGATTGSNTLDAHRDVDEQVTAYLRRHSPESHELFVFWAGVNDFNAGQTDASAAVESLTEQITRVADAGARHIFVSNVPRYLGEFSYLPLGGNFNVELDRALTDIASAHPGLSVYAFDYFGFFESVLADPIAFGFTEMTAAACANCSFGEVTDPPFGVAPNAEEFYFWDRIHLSATGNAVTADAAYAFLEEVSVGDYDNNGLVDGHDLLRWQRGKSPAYLGDANLATWEAQFGEFVPPPGARRVPEPGSLWIAAIAAFGLAARQGGCFG